MKWHHTFACMRVHAFILYVLYINKLLSNTQNNDTYQFSIITMLRLSVKILQTKMSGLREIRCDIQQLIQQTQVANIRLEILINQ